MALHHQTLSQQGPTLILLHGLFGSSENLNGIARLLSDDFSIYSLDLPCHGHSDALNTLTIPAMAEAVSNWMNDIGLQSAHFLGHSLGGKVAMEVALNHAEQVNALLVADISPIQYPRRHDDVFAAFNAVTLEHVGGRNDAFKMMETHLPDANIRHFLLKNLIKSSEGWRWRIDWRFLQANYEHLIQANSNKNSFMGDVLFLKGENSNYIQTSHTAETLMRFPKASVKVLPECGHWLHAEKPRAFASTVKRFLHNHCA